MILCTRESNLERITCRLVQVSWNGIVALTCLRRQILSGLWLAWFDSLQENRRKVSLQLLGGSSFQDSESAA